MMIISVLSIIHLIASYIPHPIPQQYVLPSDYFQQARGSEGAVGANASDGSTAEAKLVATEHIEDLD